MGKQDYIDSVIVRKPFQILNMNEKGNDRYIFQSFKLTEYLLGFLI
jgi:hypothetical protein